MDETPLLNGMLGTLSNVKICDTKLLHPKLTATFTNETGDVFDCSKFSIDYQLLTTGEPTVNNETWKKFYKKEIFENMYSDVYSIFNYSVDK